MVGLFPAAPLPTIAAARKETSAACPLAVAALLFKLATVGALLSDMMSYLRNQAYSERRETIAHGDLLEMQVVQHFPKRLRLSASSISLSPSQIHSLWMQSCSRESQD